MVVPEWFVVFMHTNPYWCSCKKRENRSPIPGTQVDYQIIVRSTKPSCKKYILPKFVKQSAAKLFCLNNFVQAGVSYEQVTEWLANQNGNMCIRKGFFGSANRRGGQNDVTYVTQLDQQNILEFGHVSSILEPHPRGFYSE